MLRLPFILLLLLTGSLCQAEQALEIVSDNELIDLVRSEKYVVVLFTKKDCEACDSLETELISIREDLVDELNCWVVKAVSSNMVKLYNPSKEPALVFFRHGVPLLYDGPASEEKILHTFSDNRVPGVKELSDENFEHLTQASTGATTGDWFVMFYTDNCVDCERLHARWEAVGARLKTRLNVARVNKGTTGAVTGRRFGVGEVPAFVLFRQGKMYRYQLPLYDVNSFASFATDWFKNAKAESIPVPKSPFDDFTQMIADYLQENPWLLGVGILSFLTGIFVAVYAFRTPVKKPAKKKDKEQAKSKKSSLDHEKILMLQLNSIHWASSLIYAEDYSIPPCKTVVTHALGVMTVLHGSVALIMERCKFPILVVPVCLTLEMIFALWVSGQKPRDNCEKWFASHITTKVR